MICNTFIQAILLFSFLANSAAFGLNAKSYIGIPSADSDQRLAVSGQGPAPAAGEGGSGAGDPAYDFAASQVNIGLPTALDDAGYAYLDDLNAAGQLTVQDMALVQHEFYDQQVQLGVLGQLALQFMTAGMTAGLTGIQAAMAQAAISGGVQGVVSGDFDIGAILTDVAFAGVSGVLTEAVNLDNILQMQAGQSLLGAVDGKFTWANLVDGLGDSVVKAGLTTAVYGGEFGDNFKGAFTSTFVNLAQADLQSLIGDRYNGANTLVNGGEGSIGHVLEHAFAGCITGAALGGSCEASAAAAAISALHAGAVDPQQALRKSGEAIALAELFGGLAAAIVSGGDTNATMIASGIAGSAFENNYLFHEEALERAQLRNQLQECSEATCTASEIQEINARLAQLDAIDQARDDALRDACNANPQGATCLARIKELAYAVQWFADPSDPWGLGESLRGQWVLDYKNADFMDRMGIDGTGFVAGDMVDEWEQSIALLNEYGESYEEVSATRYRELTVIYGTELAMTMVGGILPQTTLLRRTGGGIGTVDPATNVASADRTQHILYGDSPTSGGHLWPGQPGKTPFPQSWDANKVMRTISEVATDPNLRWIPLEGKGGLYTSKGKPARFEVRDSQGNFPIVDGVPIKVVVEPAGEGIITAFPKY